MTPIDLERIEMQFDILKGNCWGYCVYSGQGWAGLLTTGFCVQVDSFYLYYDDTKYLLFATSNGILKQQPRTPPVNPIATLRTNSEVK